MKSETLEPPCKEEDDTGTAPGESKANDIRKKAEAFEDQIAQLCAPIRTATTPAGKFQLEDGEYVFIMNGQPMLVSFHEGELQMATAMDITDVTLEQVMAHAKLFENVNFGRGTMFDVVINKRLRQNLAREWIKCVADNHDASELGATALELIMRVMLYTEDASMAKLCFTRDGNFGGKPGKRTSLNESLNAARYVIMSMSGGYIPWEMGSESED